MVYKVILGSGNQEAESAYWVWWKMEVVCKNKEEHQIGHGAQTAGYAELQEFFKHLRTFQTLARASRKIP